MKKGSRFGIGLIGFGNFGKFILPYLKEHGNVYVNDIKEIENVENCSISEAASKDLVIFSVPSQRLEGVLILAKDYIKPNAVVADVCSVKIKPCQLLEKYVPKHAEAIGTHPLFGPQSAKGGLENQTIVLCPIRINKLEKVACFLEDNFPLQIIVTSPEEHDRQMAYVQGITHFIAKALNEMNLGYKSQRTKSYELLLKLKDMLGNDSEDLFNSIQTDNPYAKEARKELIDCITKIDKLL